MCTKIVSGWCFVSDLTEGGAYENVPELELIPIAYIHSISTDGCMYTCMLYGASLIGFNRCRLEAPSISFHHATDLAVYAKSPVFFCILIPVTTPNVWRYCVDLSVHKGRL